MHYILFHGSWHGSWAFEQVRRYLEANGHTVQCEDLPGHGNDAWRAPEVIYDDLYNHVFQNLAKAPEPSVVVAHSFAGFMAARACEELHEKVHHAFYVAAWLPIGGKSLLDLALGYNNSQLPTAFADCGNPKLRALDPERAKEVFYHDCVPDLQEWAAQRLRPKAAQPDRYIMPEVAPIHSLTKSTYILCELDRVVAPTSQLDMATRFGFRENQIIRVQASHSPFLSMPDELAHIVQRG